MILLAKAIFQDQYVMAFRYIGSVKANYCISPQHIPRAYFRLLAAAVANMP